MKTDLSSILTPAALEGIQNLDAAGLAQITLRDLLGFLVSSLASSERRAFLERSPEDKANGSYSRSLQLGSLAVPLEVPRVRSGDFRPAVLPPPYQRGHPEETQNLLLGLLASSRSVAAVKASLRGMGLPVSEDDLEATAKHFLEEFNLKNSAPLPADLLAIYLDAKWTDIKEGDRLRPFSIYTVIGLDLDGKKRIIACQVRSGRESLDDWRAVLKNLLDRGLRRLLFLAQDDFSGLLPLSRSLFPETDVQLCTVHLLRNAKAHLSAQDASEFVRRFRELKDSGDQETGRSRFQDLCNRFKETAPSFIKEVERKKEHYVVFLKYPAPCRRMFSTTNAVETINNQIERASINSGGYFQSQDTLKMKLGITIAYLQANRWVRTSASIQSSLRDLRALFNARFESDPAPLQTQVS